MTLTSGCIASTVPVDRKSSVPAAITTHRRNPMMITLTVSLTLFNLLNSLFNPGIDPIQKGLVPQQAVLRLQDPVAFIGKEKELGRHFLQLQRGEEFQALRIRHAKILFAVDDQRRGFELFDEIARRPLGVSFRLVPRSTTE